MTDQARCTRCRHDRGRYDLCPVAGRVAGGGYRRTCHAFAPRLEPPPTPARLKRRHRARQPTDPIARWFEIRPHAGHLEVHILPGAPRAALLGFVLMSLERAIHGATR